MAESPVLLNQFFGVDQVSKETVTALVKTKEFQKLKGKLKKEMPAISLSESFFEMIVGHLSEVLHIDVRAILLNTWNTSSEILQYADSKKYPPEQAFMVPLVEHTIISEHTPSLKLTLNKAPVGEIELDVKLELTVKGVILKIQNKRIMALNPGTCKGNGSVRYGDLVLIQKKSSFDFPGLFALGAGIPLNETAANLHAIVDAVAKA